MMYYDVIVVDSRSLRLVTHKYITEERLERAYRNGGLDVYVNEKERIVSYNPVKLPSEKDLNNG